MLRKIKKKHVIPSVNEYIRHLSGDRDRMDWEMESCANVVKHYEGRVVNGADSFACGRAFAHLCRAIAVLSFRKNGIRVFGQVFTGIRGLTPKSKTPTMDAIMRHLGFDENAISRATPQTRDLIERFKLDPGCVSVGRAGDLTIFEAKLPSSSPWWNGPVVSWAEKRTLPNGDVAQDIGPRPKGTPPLGVSPRKRKTHKPAPKPPKRRLAAPGAPRMGPPKPPMPPKKRKKVKTTPPPPPKR